MSLLTNGPHTAIVTLFKEPETADRSGRKTPVVDKVVTVTDCSFRPMTADEVQAFGGKMVETGYRVTHANWPGGPYSLIEWNGMRFRQVGDTLVNSRGKRTKHTKAYLEASTARVK